MFVGLKATFKNIQYDFFKWCRNSELKCAVLRPLITPVISKYFFPKLILQTSCYFLNDERKYI